MNHLSRHPIVISAVFAFGLLGRYPSVRAADDSNKVKPGEFIIDHPTLINLGFEWLIEGDDNRNAQVQVSYRKQWRDAVEEGDCRFCACKANGSTRIRVSSTSSLPICSRAAFWIWSRIRNMKPGS